MKNTFLFAAVLLSAAILTGCSKNVPLSGRITFADNGEPLTEGTIAFVNGTNQARGEIDKDGHYTLGFDKEGNGLPKGGYKVYIQAVHVELQTGPEKNAYGHPIIIDRTETPLIDDKYKSPETSELTYFVDGKAKVFDIKVERAVQEKSLP